MRTTPNTDPEPRKTHNIFIINSNDVKLISLVKFSRFYSYFILFLSLSSTIFSHLLFTSSFSLATFINNNIKLLNVHDILLIFVVSIPHQWANYSEESSKIVVKLKTLKKSSVDIAELCYIFKHVKAAFKIQISELPFLLFIWDIPWSFR